VRTDITGVGLVVVVVGMLDVEVVFAALVVVVATGKVEVVVEGMSPCGELAPLANTTNNTNTPMMTTAAPKATEIFVAFDTWDSYLVVDRKAETGGMTIKGASVPSSPGPA